MVGGPIIGTRRVISPHQPFGLNRGAVVGPIGTPVGIGSVNKSTTSQTTATFLTTGAISAGDLLVIAISTLQSSGAGVASVSDGVNSFTRAVQQQNGQAFLEIWYCENASARASGVTVTVTMSVATLYCSAGLARVPGAQTTGSLDKAVPSTSLPVATGTLSSAPQVVFGAVGGFNFTSVTEDAAFTQLNNINNGGQVSLSFGYKAAAVTTTVSYNPTVTGSGGNLCYAVASFE
jgi:hypothetical protein